MIPSNPELIQEGDCVQEVCYGIATLHQDISSLDQEAFLNPVSHFRPDFSRRPSHDLFECIEQSPQKRLSESQARYVFAQIVEAVAYLDAQGITHCDIKDENILIDTDLNVGGMYLNLNS
jgi:serine/threonine protein kinase